MHTVNIILSDKEDGTLGVQIIADPSEGYSVSNHVANLFLEMLQDLQNTPQIVVDPNQ
jgi:hypothetical protein